MKVSRGRGKSSQQSRSKSRDGFRRGDALLLIDCLNDLEFPGGEKVLPWAMKMTPRLLAFRSAARRAGMPVIYANDNYGQWRGNASDVVRHCTRANVRGRPVSAKLKPGRDDYVILKTRHSAFFATPMVPLLEHLGVKRLILAGIATNLCVLFTAHDAYMHHYELLALSDCCAAESDFDHDVALGQLKRFCNAGICRSDEFGWTAPSKRRRAKSSQPTV